jgi:hypothetical protein
MRRVNICAPKLLQGKVVWLGLHGDASRTVVIARDNAFANVIRHAGDKWFMILRYTQLVVGWMICRKKSIEKPVEFAPADETNVANLHAVLPPSWTWLPQGMSTCRILDR